MRRARQAIAFGPEELPTGFKEYWTDPAIKPMGMTAYYDVAKRAYAAGFKAGFEQASRRAPSTERSE